jgi:hypothetical protein
LLKPDVSDVQEFEQESRQALEQAGIENIYQRLPFRLPGDGDVIFPGIKVRED